MKKFESVFFLELGLVIYKFLVLALTMTAAFLILYFTRGIKYIDNGFQWVCFLSGFDKVSWISFVICAMMLIISRTVNLNSTNYRYELLRMRPREIGWIQCLVTYTIMLLWYAVVILDFILVAWIFTMHPGYAGGPNGILCSFSTITETRILIPVGQPLLFLLNIVVLAVASLLVNIPCFLKMKKLKREGNANEQ